MPYQPPRWEIDGHFTMCAQREHVRQSIIAIRMYPDGHGTMTVNGVCYPIRKGMTVEEHYNRMFEDAYGLPPMAALSSGD